MSGVLYAATLVTALGCGLIAGAFFAFSSFVMDALKRLAPEQGISAMQSINVLAVTPVFMTALFGTAAACLGLVGWATISWGEGPAAPVLAGCAFYLVGTVGVTIARNVPLNERLAKLHPRGRRSGGLLGGVRHEVDRVEPREDGRRPGRGGPADGRAPRLDRCTRPHGWIGTRCGSNSGSNRGDTGRHPADGESETSEQK